MYVPYQQSQVKDHILLVIVGGAAQIKEYDDHSYFLVYPSDAADDLLCVELGGRLLSMKEHSFCLLFVLYLY